jgi:hypothetical protein
MNRLFKLKVLTNTDEIDEFFNIQSELKFFFLDLRRTALTHNNGRIFRSEHNLNKLLMEII